MRPISPSYQKYQTPDGRGDKGTRHSYIPVYERLLPENCKALYEIGVAKNALSLRLWAEVFPDALIVGCDIDVIELESPLPDNVRIVQADGTTFMPDQTFDVIIDDGSHRGRDQVKSYDLLWPSLNSGGIYFVEDLRNPFLDFHWHHGGKCDDDGLAWKIKSLF